MDNLEMEGEMLSSGLGQEERATLFQTKPVHNVHQHQEKKLHGVHHNQKRPTSSVHKTDCVEQIDSGFHSEFLTTSENLATSFDTQLNVKSEEEQEQEFLQIYKSLSQKDSDGDTVLHTAVIQENKEAVNYYTDFLMDASPLDIQNNHGQTPLMLAVITKQKELVRTFVKFGAALDLRDKSGYTALHYASEKGHADCALMLIHPLTSDETQEVCYDVVPFRAHKGLLNWKTNEGHTCLELAVLKRQFNMIMFLCVYMKDDVNYKEGTQGNTPLHTAVLRQDFVMVQFLVHEFKNKRSRLDIDAKRYDGWTAYQLAFHRQTDISQKIAQYLKSWGASEANFVEDEGSDDSMDEPCIVDHDNPMEFEDM